MVERRTFSSSAAYRKAKTLLVLDEAFRSENINSYLFSIQKTLKNHPKQN
jgi:hypothetical protein